jgi:hypothetical protein
VLEIATTLGATPSAPVILVVSVSVNGVSVEPGPGWNTGQDCSANNAVACGVSDTRWLDIDAAEAANPGMFIGQPLTVTMSGGAY